MDPPPDLSVPHSFTGMPRWEYQSRPVFHVVHSVHVQHRKLQTAAVRILTGSPVIDRSKASCARHPGATAIKGGLAGAVSPPLCPFKHTYIWPYLECTTTCTACLAALSRLADGMDAVDLSRCYQKQPGGIRPRPGADVEVEGEPGLISGSQLPTGYGRSLEHLAAHPASRRV